MKDVGSCEKLRGVATQTLIRRYPNGKTRAGESQPSHAEYIGMLKPTRGTETSKYPEEQKSKEIPLVAASERGIGQTSCTCTTGVVGRPIWIKKISGTFWKVRA